jgi:hypothetical protein
LLTTIPSIVDPVFSPIDRILSLVLPVVGTTVRSVSDAIPTLLAKFLLVLKPVTSILDSVMPSLDSGIDTSRYSYMAECQAQGHSSNENCLIIHLTNTSASVNEH